MLSRFPHITFTWRTKFKAIYIDEWTTVIHRQIAFQKNRLGIIPRECPTNSWHVPQCQQEHSGAGSSNVPVSSKACSWYSSRRGLRWVHATGGMKGDLCGVRDTVSISRPNCVPVSYSGEHVEHEPFAALDTPLESAWGLWELPGGWGCCKTYTIKHYFQIVATEIYPCPLF